jgi:hypothetical protein
VRLDPQTARAVAIATAIGLAIIAAFQVALALGVPWGRAAYGGTSATLPPELRVASAVAAMVWLLAAAVVLGRAGHWGSARWSAAFGWGTWLVAGLLGLGAIVNFASSSPLGALRLGPAGPAAGHRLRRPRPLASCHAGRVTASVAAVGDRRPIDGR